LSEGAQRKPDFGEKMHAARLNDCADMNKSVLTKRPGTGSICRGHHRRDGRAANCACPPFGTVAEIEATTDAIEYRDTRDLPPGQVLALYRALGWSSADKPSALLAALAGSHQVVTAWHGDRLVGLGNTISDGALVVYYPHLAVHPDYQRRGIGREIVRRLRARYADFHQHAVLADGDAVDFYQKCGFTRPAAVQAMWIDTGHDHGPADAHACDAQAQGPNSPDRTRRPVT